MNSKAILEIFKRYDFTFLGISTAIFIMGIVNLYSATHASTYLSGLYKTQLVLYCASCFVAVVVSLIQPKNFFRYSYFFYLFIVVLLILVLVLGHEGMGARRWLLLGPVRIQPSEIAKIAAILVLGRWFAKVNPDREMGLKDLIIPAIIAGVPTILIVMQPDLGTGLLILLIFLVMSFYRKLKWKTIGILALIGIISGGVMYKFGLKEYQRRRISTFLNPGKDARGSGYNAIQSKIAIGSGQFLGKGFKQSTQASLNYLPENHTDFVFSIFNEEHGLLGSLFLIALYVILLFRYLILATTVPRIFDSIVMVGMMALVFWHTIINMSMVTGLMPIVGLPLPFMSYGGSSLLTFGICNGIATSISNSRNLF